MEHLAESRSSEFSCLACILLKTGHFEIFSYRPENYYRMRIDLRYQPSLALKVACPKSRMGITLISALYKTDGVVLPNVALPR